MGDLTSFIDRMNPRVEVIVLKKADNISASSGHNFKGRRSIRRARDGRDSVERDDAFLAFLGFILIINQEIGSEEEPAFLPVLTDVTELDEITLLDGRQGGRRRFGRARQGSNR